MFIEASRRTETNRKAEDTGRQVRSRHKALTEERTGSNKVLSAQVQTEVHKPSRPEGGSIHMKLNMLQAYIASNTSI
jgi:hypothetical protein